MIVEGRKIRDEIKRSLKEEINERGITPSLSLIYVGSHAVIDSYVGLKQAFGKDIGVEVEVIRLDRTISEDALIRAVKERAESETNGIVLQLPLPDHIDAQNVSNEIPPEKDPDVLSDKAFEKFVNGTSLVIPPVVASVREILERHAVTLQGRKIVVVGRGKLVGKPISLWLLREGTAVTILKKGDSLSQVVPTADILISGAGTPHLITPDLVKKGSVLIDAGTSDVSGETKGDIDPATAEKAMLFSPVPGGVGPITIAMLFRNLVELTAQSKRS